MSSSYRQVQWAMIALLTLSKSRAGCTSMDIAKSYWEFSNFVRVLTIPQKCHLLKYHKQPHEDRAFPTRYLGGCHQGGFQHVTHQYSLQSTFGLSTVRRWMVHSMLVVLLNIIVLLQIVCKSSFWVVVFFCKIARTIPVTPCRCENSSQHLYASINKEKLAGTSPNLLWYICRPGQGGGLHCLVSSLLTVLCWVASEHNEWLHPSCNLRWHACHSAEVSENINLGYIQDQGYS